MRKSGDADPLFQAAREFREKRAQQRAAAPKPRPAKHVDPYVELGQELPVIVLGLSPAEYWDAANECRHGLLACPTCHPGSQPATYPGVRGLARQERRSADRDDQ